MVMNPTNLTQNLSFIGLGSNLLSPAEQIYSARAAILQIKAVVEHSFSSLYQSSPMGPQDQPDYTNAVMGIYTDLEAIELLRKLQTIENSHGRVRKQQQWGARTLDLDILLFGDQSIEIADLRIPHYGMAEREFVLYPLQEITSDLTVPGLGKLDDLIAKCPRNGLKRVTT